MYGASSSATNHQYSPPDFFFGSKSRYLISSSIFVTSIMQVPIDLIYGFIRMHNT